MRKEGSEAQPWAILTQLVPGSVARSFACHQVSLLEQQWSVLGHMDAALWSLMMLPADVPIAETHRCCHQQPCWEDMDLLEAEAPACPWGLSSLEQLRGEATPILKFTKPSSVHSQLQ